MAYKAKLFTAPMYMRKMCSPCMRTYKWDLI